MGSESTFPKTSPTEISTVTSTSTVPTSRADVAPTEEQKPDGATVVFVVREASATDGQKCDVSPSLLEGEQSNPGSESNPSSSETSKDLSPDLGNKVPNFRLFLKIPRIQLVVIPDSLSMNILSECSRP